MLVHQAEDGNIVVEVDRASREGSREIAVESHATRSAIVIRRLDDGPAAAPARVDGGVSTTVHCILHPVPSAPPTSLRIGFDGAIVLSVPEGLAYTVNGSSFEGVDVHLLAPIVLGLPSGSPLIEVHISETQGRLIIDALSGALLVDRRMVIPQPSALERELIAVLDAYRPNPVPTTLVGDAIWGPGLWDEGMLHNVLWRLRQKLRRAGVDPDGVLARVRGHGYRLV